MNIEPITHIDLGDGILCPTMQFEIAPHKRAMIVGVDLFKWQGRSINVTDLNGWKCEVLGLLSEMTRDFQARLVASLIAEQWDRLQYPNPLIILLTENENSKIIIPNGY